MDDQVIPLKRCYACGEEFPATKQFFQSHNQKSDGLSPRCKSCIKTMQKPIQLEEPIPEGHKRCTRCRQILPATSDFFSRHKQMKDGLRPRCKSCCNVENREYEATHADSRQQYRQEHRQYRNARQREYHAAHKEVMSLKRKQWYQQHREESCLARKQYVEINKEQVYRANRIYREAHRDELNAYSRKYAKTNPDKMKVYRHTRDARMKSVEGALTPVQIQAKLKAQRYRCYYAACGHAKFEKKDGRYIYHLEHTIPISRTNECPRNDVNYVVLSCPTCNLRKRNKLPHEWSEGGRLF